jgi:hypothetical protein
MRLTKEQYDLLKTIVNYGPTGGDGGDACSVMDDLIAHDLVHVARLCPLRVRVTEAGLKALVEGALNGGFDGNENEQVAAALRWVEGLD